MRRRRNTGEGVNIMHDSRETGPRACTKAVRQDHESLEDHGARSGGVPRAVAELNGPEKICCRNTFKKAYPSTIPFV